MSIEVDISLSRAIYFLTMVGRANAHKDAHSASSAENEILIKSGKWVRAVLYIIGIFIFTPYLPAIIQFVSSRWSKTAVYHFVLGKKLYLLSGSITGVIGTIDEIYQHFLPRRYLTVYDIFLNILGGISGLLVFWGTRRQ